MANFSGISLARLLGVISPKISTTTVETMVETVAPASAIKCTNSRVHTEVMAMFTMLLPIRMEVIILSYLSESSRARMAFLSPFSASTFSRVLFSEEKAVSVAEK